MSPILPKNMFQIAITRLAPRITVSLERWHRGPGHGPACLGLLLPGRSGSWDQEGAGAPHLKVTTRKCNLLEKLDWPVALLTTNANPFWNYWHCNENPLAFREDLESPQNEDLEEEEDVEEDEDDDGTESSTLGEANSSIRAPSHCGLHHKQMPSPASIQVPSMLFHHVLL